MGPRNERSRTPALQAEGHRLAMFSTILLKCCASNLNHSFMLGRLGLRRGVIDQEQAGVRPPRNQAAMLGLRGQILRSRPEAAGLFALRRDGRAKARERRSGNA